MTFGLSGLLVERLSQRLSSVDMQSVGVVVSDCVLVANLNVEEGNTLLQPRLQARGVAASSDTATKADSGSGVLARVLSIAVVVSDRPEDCHRELIVLDDFSQLLHLCSFLRLLFEHGFLAKSRLLESRSFEA